MMSFYEKLSVNVTSSGISSPFYQNHFPHYVNNFTFAKFLWLQLESLPSGSKANIPKVSYLRLSTINFIFASSFIAFFAFFFHLRFFFLLAALLPLLASFLFGLPNFVTCQVGLSLGARMQQKHMLCCPCLKTDS